MDIFQWFDQLTGSTERSIQGLVFIAGILAVGWATNWFRNWSFGRIATAVLAAAFAAVLIKNPGFLAPSIEQTVSISQVGTPTSQVLALPQAVPEQGPAAGLSIEHRAAL